MNTFKRNIKLLFTFLLTLFILTSSSFLCLAKDNLVDPTDEFYVNDYANILDDNVEQYIIDVNEEFESLKQKPQVVVTTVVTLNNMDIEEYAYKLYDKFKIGNKKLDNGVLILLAPNERDIRIEVGYGLEGAIPDSKAGSILDSSMSFLSNNDFSLAVENIFSKVCNEIASEYNYNTSDLGIDKSLESFIAIEKETAQNKFFTFIFAFVAFLIVLALVAVDLLFNDLRVTTFIFYLLDIITSFGGSSSGGSGRNSGGGGRSGGGGASRGF